MRGERCGLLDPGPPRPGRHLPRPGRPSASRPSLPPWRHWTDRLVISATEPPFSIGRSLRDIARLLSVSGPVRMPDRRARICPSCLYGWSRRPVGSSRRSSSEGPNRRSTASFVRRRSRERWSSGGGRCVLISRSRSSAARKKRSSGAARADSPSGSWTRVRRCWVLYASSSSTTGGDISPARALRGSERTRSSSPSDDSPARARPSPSKAPAPTSGPGGRSSSGRSGARYARRGLGSGGDSGRSHRPRDLRRPGLPLTPRFRFSPSRGGDHERRGGAE